MESALPDFPFIPVPTGKIPAQSPWGQWLAKIKRLVNAAAHISGTIALSAGTINVVFATSQIQPDTSYFIALSGNADERFHWSAKAKTGFTITSSNNASTANVDYTVTR